jgi:hypothetical protein
MSSPFDEGGVPNTTGRPFSLLNSGGIRVAIVRGTDRSVSWIIQHPSLQAPGVPNQIYLLNYTGGTIRPLFGGQVTEVGRNRVLVIRDSGMGPGGVPSTTPIHMIDVNGTFITLPSDGPNAATGIRQHISGAGDRPTTGTPFETTRDRLRGVNGQSLDVLNDGGVRISLTRGIHDAGTVSWVIQHPSFSAGEERTVRLLNRRGGEIGALNGRVGRDGILTLTDDGVPNASIHAIEIGGHRIELPQSGTNRQGTSQRVFDFVQQHTPGNSSRAGVPRP